MADMCGQCLNIDWDNKEQHTSRVRYYCNEMRKYVEPKDSSCRYFDEDKSITQNDSGGFQQSGIKYNQSGCYITTIIVNILGYPDDCELLTVLRNFRDNTLKTNINYLPLLFEYDRIGPIITNYIIREKNNHIFALGLLNHFLLPCTYAIKQNNIEEAIEIYKNMVMYLNDTFNLPTIEIKNPTTYDLETLGKGRIRQPKTSEI